MAGDGEMAGDGGHNCDDGEEYGNCGHGGDDGETVEVKVVIVTWVMMGTCYHMFPFYPSKTAEVISGVHSMGSGNFNCERDCFNGRIEDQSVRRRGEGDTEKQNRTERERCHASNVDFLVMVKRSRSIVELSPSKTLIGKPVSSQVAHFSARGPNSISPAILKPDIAAPGVGILATSSYDPAMDGGFALLSGTSMATPHIAGLVALLKSLQPDWSPAAMKSALVTTAWKTDPFGEPIFAEGAAHKLADLFDYGGGLVNPNKAANPGLIYIMDTNDYINYLCAFGYNTSAISLLVKQATSCPVPKPSILDVNLPSITIPNLSKKSFNTHSKCNKRWSWQVNVQSLN
ncbi:subtilisin-like protease [Pyrus ussuriensis x Pyrus communis]|uniref:Subtilisin-like protease n=1 Tax=Pyrus ussuriensis x Pyrus communis TaxID=2448454 RepID=A0A5N5G0N7_9ROSA|nr:subtilisin-like protease [Pyrus ussuriensis x Pyrus communis]